MPLGLSRVPLPTPFQGVSWNGADGQNVAAVLFSQTKVLSLKSRAGTVALFVRCKGEGHLRLFFLGYVPEQTGVSRRVGMSS